MDINNSVSAFVELGKSVQKVVASYQRKQVDLSELEQKLLNKVYSVRSNNGWFVEESVIQALNGLLEMLEAEKLVDWIGTYINKIPVKESKTVAIIMAGNLPMVGFHDLLCVVVSGHKALVKLSKDDDQLIPILVELLQSNASELKERINFESAKLIGFDAVIATGSNNTSRYFDYYFGKYPNIIRKNRTSIAVLSGKESDIELEQLSSDVFSYFGMGCRNVSKVFVPKGYKFDGFIEVSRKYFDFLNMSKFQNNLDYHKSILLLNKVKFLDGGHIFIQEEKGLHSPISILYYQEYEDLSEVEAFIAEHQKEIQCRVGIDGLNFGTTQTPGLSDYADNVDVVEFLIGIS